MALLTQLAKRALGQLGWEVHRSSSTSDSFGRGLHYGKTTSFRPAPRLRTDPNALESYVDAHVDGPGLWKWQHYLPVYDRHLAKFVGRSVNVVEIGVFSGGSLGMWHSYFGSGCQVFGVDVEPACRAHEASGTRIFIGDQADPEFWTRFVAQVPEVDVIIDDGGHEAFQQIETLEALLRHLRPGGVYICEDVLTERHDFHNYVHGLSLNLHEVGADVPDGYSASGFQAAVDSVHLYPFLTVIEMRSSRIEHLVAPKRGTQWEPFYETMAFPTGSSEMP